MRLHFEKIIHSEEKIVYTKLYKTWPKTDDPWAQRIVYSRTQLRSYEIELTGGYEKTKY